MVEPLEFKVASHIVEDLGLNLYTSLPRVLVEFVANAYDADSPFVDITYDRKAIDAARKLVKAEFQREKAAAEANLAAGKEASEVQPLEERTLGEGALIVIRDAGVGMSRDDLRDKFLVAGRRRRKEDKSRNTLKGRAIMGRKGLGKLAGFGVSKKVEVLTKAAGNTAATRIELRYDDLVKSRTVDKVVVPDFQVTNPQGIAKGGTGTIITLSELLYDPTKSRDDTIEAQIADHFAQVDPNDFTIKMNATPVAPPPRIWSFAWPKPEIASDQLVRGEFETGDDGDKLNILYRVRFVALGKGLPASERGVRIYANKRLASSPSLLDADTNVHGFRMSDYLDGVAHADFIDEQPADYIATDRQGLRWDAPLLASMRDFLSNEMSAAIRAYQNKRDTDNDEKVKKDSFTKATIDDADLTTADKKLCRQVARELAKAYPEGVEDPGYRSTLPALVQAIGHGGILSAIDKLANEDNPELKRVAAQIGRLTRDELEAFAKRAKARLRAIEALEKVVKGADFNKPDNERDIQKLLEESPWLIDPTYTQFVTADRREDALYDRLAKELKIDTHAQAPIDSEKRPDLVFLLGNPKVARLVIVELKSANKPLDVDHLNQLERYMAHARKWFKQQKHEGIKVEGQLIGTFAKADSTAEKVESLRIEMEKHGPSTPLRVRDYLGVLGDTKDAHLELLNLQKLADDASDAAPESE